MNRLLNYLIFQGWMSYLMTAGLLLFSSGFLLHRVTRTEHANCSSYCSPTEGCDIKSIIQQDIKHEATICLRQKAKVVLLVVDALKFEFASWHNDEASSSSYHRNKLPIFHELLQKYPTRSRLYKFIAHPPTTTMQRLKGLTTGSLPTFIDISSNFASESIDEDNIVDQNVANGIIFMGDDTWVGLYPSKFRRQFPSSSFNVWDLDNVDKDVRYRIFFELKKNDWSLLIAHILGIDHCGHKHGPKHPEMLRKLNDTNTLIQEIVQSLDNDTMLFVVGDHGMTENGDHGGDSPAEVEAAMFVYSTIPLFNHATTKDIRSVDQIDLVPTLASILGTAIPFSNLGSVIVDALPSSVHENDTENTIWYPLHSIWANIIQSKKYVDAYSSDTKLFSDEQLQNIDTRYNELLQQIKYVNGLNEFKVFLEDTKNYFDVLKNTCAEAWVQFDSSLMSKGLLLMFCTLFFFYVFITGIPESRMIVIFKSSFLRHSVCVNIAVAVITFFLFAFNFLDDFKNSAFVATGAVSIFLLGILIIQNWDVVSTRWYNQRKMEKVTYIGRVVLASTVCSLFSNSYIVEEADVLSFLLLTVLSTFLITLGSDKVCEYSEKRFKVFPRTVEKSYFRKTSITVGLAACICIRLSYYFWQCREEQRSCFAFVTGKAGALTSNNLERILLAITLLALALYITIIRLWLQNCGSLSGFAPSVIVGRYCPVIIGVCMGSYWVLQWLPKFIKMKFTLSWQVNALPNVVYVLCLIAIIILYCRPLGVFLLPAKKDNIVVYQDENVVPKLFEKIKDSIRRKDVATVEEMPIVYGLGTVYSATFISLSVFLTLLYSLLLGHILSPSTFLLFVTSASVLWLSALERFKNANSLSELLDVPTPTLLCWFLIAEYFFYATGHQSTFPTIHWDAAFVGTGSHYYGNLLPAILIGINTFGSHIILGAALPLLVVVPLTLYFVFPKRIKVKFSEDRMKKGELVLFEEDSIFHTAIFSVAGKYVLFHGIRTFGSMLAATIHCRHLMVWKIFAPKLIFTGLGFLISMCSVLASFYMVFRIDQQMEHLINQVTKNR